MKLILSIPGTGVIQRIEQENPGIIRVSFMTAVLKASEIDTAMKQAGAAGKVLIDIQAKITDILESTPIEEHLAIIGKVCEFQRNGGKTIFVVQQ